MLSFLPVIDFASMKGSADDLVLGSGCRACIGCSQSGVSGVGRLLTDTGMRSMLVVTVQPSGQFRSAFLSSVGGTCIGPFAWAGLDGAFGLDLGRMGLGADVPETVAEADEVPTEGASDEVLVAESVTACEGPFPTHIICRFSL